MGGFLCNPWRKMSEEETRSLPKGKGNSKWSRRRTFAPAASATQQASTNSGLRFCPYKTILRPTTWREANPFHGVLGAKWKQTVREEATELVKQK